MGVATDEEVGVVCERRSSEAPPPTVVPELLVAAND